MSYKIYLNCNIKRIELTTSKLRLLFISPKKVDIIVKAWMLLPDTVKGALSDLRQLLATESPFKMMKIAFPFTSKAPFALKIFRFLP